MVRQPDQPGSISQRNKDSGVDFSVRVLFSARSPFIDLELILQAALALAHPNREAPQILVKLDTRSPSLHSLLIDTKLDAGTKNGPHLFHEFSSPRPCRGPQRCHNLPAMRSSEYWHTCLRVLFV